jgi:YcxB-like protein
LAPPLINAGIMFVGASGDGAERQLAATLGIFVISLLAMIILLLPCYWWGARSGWTTPGALQPIDYEFDADGMRVRSAIGDGRTTWAIFTGVVENSKFMLLRQRPGLLHIFPKRDIAPEAIQRLRALVVAHVRRS